MQRRGDRFPELKGGCGLRYDLARCHNSSGQVYVKALLSQQLDSDGCLLNEDEGTEGKYVTEKETAKTRIGK